MNYVKEIMTIELPGTAVRPEWNRMRGNRKNGPEGKNVVDFVTSQTYNI